MLQLTSWVAGKFDLAFHVEQFFWDAVLGALIITFVSMILGFFNPERSDSALCPDAPRAAPPAVRSRQGRSNASLIASANSDSWWGSKQPISRPRSATGMVRMLSRLTTDS